MSRKTRLSKLSIVITILLLLAAWVWQEALRPPAPAGFGATFLSVGQGDCCVVRTPSGRTMLMDGGTYGSGNIGYDLIAPYLRRQGINTIDVLVISHPHADHINGLIAVLSDFDVGLVLDPAIPHPSATYRDFLRAVRDRKIPFRKAVRGQVIDLGDGARAEVINPPDQHLRGTEDDVNNNSVVVRVTSGGDSIMLAGDAGCAAEADMLESALNLRSDLLKVAHHGSSDATSDAWLDAVDPEVADISVGRNNPFGHPHRETIQRLSGRGIEVRRTDEDGAVTVSFSGGRPSVATVRRD